MERVERLIQAAKTPEERAYLLGVKRLLAQHRIEFQPEWELFVKQRSCGHYEIFPAPHPAAAELKELSEDRICSRCLCNCFQEIQKKEARANGNC